MSQATGEPGDVSGTDGLRAPHTLAYSYRRSVGGAVGRFLSGLAERQIWGSRAANGTVEVPPVDWDPATGQPAAAMVRVAEVGTVRSWTWIADPPPGGPTARPHALALVQLDGADTALLHVVDTSDADSLRTGMRVRVDWRDRRSGSVLDIRAFVPVADDVSPAAGCVRDRLSDRAGVPPEVNPAHEVVDDVELRFTYEPGRTLSRFLLALAHRRIEGGRCPTCGGVYVPPHPFCPECHTGPLEPVELDDRGIVTAYTVVHIPVPGAVVDPPFVTAWIRLDGADVSFAHLLGEVDPEKMRVGLRVEAAWVDQDELAPTWESIRYFRPSAERDSAEAGDDR